MISKYYYPKEILLNIITDNILDSRTSLEEMMKMVDDYKEVYKLEPYDVFFLISATTRPGEKDEKI
jgi:hypothetical protein